MKSQIADQADFSIIRYAQCWEDADILLEALRIRPGAVCVSIASAGDNSLSLLTADPARVIAVDLNPAQLACVELRVAGYRRLQHHELLELLGARESTDRSRWYQACRGELSKPVQRFWDERQALIAEGIGGSGKFERYFRLFRSCVLPLVHGRKEVATLLAIESVDEARRYYAESWNTWRWRILFHLFFSRRVMGYAGRDPAFFQYVEGSVASRILTRTRHALTEITPASNPYLNWILTGTFGKALPHALREENFESIRTRLDRFEWRRSTLEELIDGGSAGRVNAWNLSDIFEYMSEEATAQLLGRLAAASAPGARLAYWNMLAPRSRPESMRGVLLSHHELGDELLARDKAFFYSRFVVEEVSA